MVVMWWNLTVCTENSSTNTTNLLLCIQTFLCFCIAILGLFKHLQVAVSIENALVLLKAYQKNVDCKKKYGPEVSVKYVKCLGELAEVCASIN
jgi:hypothetical protein